MVMTASVDNDSLPELHVSQHVVVPLAERLGVPSVDRDEEVRGGSLDDTANIPSRSVAGDVHLVVLAATEERQPVKQLVLVDRHLWAERSALGQDECDRAGIRPVSNL